MLSRFFAKQPETKASQSVGIAVADPFTLALFGLGEQVAGIVVTPESAMSCTAFRAAVTTIADPVGQLPIHVFQRNADGTKVHATDHPAQRLLQTDANDWTSGQELREQVTLDALLHGNGYAFVNRVNGVPVELIRLFPPSVLVTVDLVTNEPFYNFTDGAGVKRVIDRGDMIHIRGPSVRGLVGDSPVVQCRDAIALAILLQNHGTRLFANGARPSGVLSFPMKLTAEVAKRISTAWAALHSGSSAGGTAVLEEGGKFEPLTFSSVDAQFLEMRRFAIEEIARVYRVPNHMLGEMGRATHANAETLNRQFLQLCLRPWLERWESQARKLLSPDERNTFFAEFNTDDLLKTDLQARATAYATLIAARIISPNEARAIENLSPVTGLDTYENPNTSSAPASNDNTPGKVAA